MSFLQKFHEHDLALIQMLDGRDVIYTPDGGSPRVISGMLQDFSKMASGETIDVVSSVPTLSVRIMDVPEIKIGDLMNIESQDYKVRIIRPDNEGMVEIELEIL